MNLATSEQSIQANLTIENLKRTSLLESDAIFANFIVCQFGLDIREVNREKFGGVHVVPTVRYHLSCNTA